MKLTQSRIFDADKIIAAFAQAEVTGIDDFVTNVSDLTDQLVRVLRNRVSLDDNIDGLVKEIEIFHNNSLIIANPSEKRKLRHIIATRSYSFDNPVTALAWRYTQDGSIELKAQLLGAPTTKTKITLALLY